MHKHMSILNYFVHSERTNQKAYCLCGLANREFNACDGEIFKLRKIMWPLQGIEMISKQLQGV